MTEAENKSTATPKADRRVATSGDIEVATYLEIAKEIGGEQPTAAREAVGQGALSPTPGRGLK